MTIITIPSSKAIKSSKGSLVIEVEADAPPPYCQAKFLEAADDGFSPEHVLAEHARLERTEFRMMAFRVATAALILLGCAMLVLLYGDSMCRAHRRASRVHQVRQYESYTYIAAPDDGDDNNNSGNDGNGYAQHPTAGSRPDYDENAADDKLPAASAEAIAALFNAAASPSMSADDKAVLRLVHDYDQNVTGIVDAAKKHCFVLSLVPNSSSSSPPTSIFDLVFRMSNKDNSMDLKKLMRTMHIVKPAITDLTNYGMYISKDCAEYSTYKLEGVAAYPVASDDSGKGNDKGDDKGDDKDDDDKGNDKGDDKGDDDDDDDDDEDDEILNGPFPTSVRFGLRRDYDENSDKDPATSEEAIAARSDLVTPPSITIVNKIARFIYDFSINVIGIVDVEEKRCFVLPLDRSSLSAPKSMFDLVFKMSNEYHAKNLSKLLRHMRIVKPAIKDLSGYGTYITKDCAEYSTYKLKEVAAYPVASDDSGKGNDKGDNKDDDKGNDKGDDKSDDDEDDEILNGPFPTSVRFGLRRDYDENSDKDPATSEEAIAARSDLVTPPSITIVNKIARFIYDFSLNVTGIVDVEESRCFVLPLVRSSLSPPKSMFDLVFKMSNEYHAKNLSKLLRHMRIVKPAIKDLSGYGTYISKECANYPTFKLEEANSTVV